MKFIIRRRIIIAIITLSMLVLSGNSLTTRAEGSFSGIVWTEDFDDGTYAPEWTVMEGDYSASEYFLQAGNDKLQYYTINRTSTITSGTWSFDVFFDGYVSMGNYLRVYPISSGSISLPQSGLYLPIENGYGFTQWYDGFELNKWNDGEYISFCYDNSFDFENTFNWHHIDITRDSSGKFNVFVNGTLLLQAIDSTHQSSENFIFNSKWNHAIDNITVDDTINVHPGPSDLKFTQESVPVECELGASEDVQINVKNYGEDFGNASLVVGTTPDGITVSLDSETITDLRSKGQNYKVITATIDVTSTVEAGAYDVIIELKNQSADVIDSITLDTTVTEADTTTTTNGNGTPGFMVVWTFLTIGLAALIYRKRR
ncbi:MAG: hypothetical protein ACFE8U_09600 [Candidatus Hermodarchaeota archaeon]